MTEPIGSQNPAHIRADANAVEIDAMEQFELLFEACFRVYNVESDNSWIDVEAVDVERVRN